jgi:hypothetical protein
MFFLLVILPDHANAVTFKFGRSGKIIYNLKSGTFNAYEKSTELLRKGFSSFKKRKHTQIQYNAFSCNGNIFISILHINTQCKH